MRETMNPAETLRVLGDKARAGELDVLRFLEDNFIIENGLPIRFEPWQREFVLDPVLLMEDGRRKWDTFLNGIGKKNGKSTLSAVVATYALLLDDPSPEVYCAAGDKDQARIIFRTVRKSFERSPRLAPFVNIYGDVIERIDGNGFFRVLSADAATSHGFNASAVIWDELWNQPSWDLWEALTHSPARKNAFHFVVTYSGYQARTGNLLWDLYSRGIAGEDPRQYTFWRSGPDANLASWVTAEYLESQRRRLPDHIFRRLHWNEWSVAKDSKAFRVPAECWRGSFEEPIEKARYVAGIDLAKVRDFTAWFVIRTDVRPYRVVDFGKLPHGDYTAQVDTLTAKLSRFRRPHTLVDAGAAGTAVIEMLQNRGLDIRPFSFTSDSKAEIVSRLSVAFEQRQILLPGAGRTLDEKRHIADLEAEIFNFEPSATRTGKLKYEGARGTHDDLVCALCLAFEAANLRDSSGGGFLAVGTKSSGIRILH
jgi:hypothetical protein